MKHFADETFCLQNCLSKLCQILTLTENILTKIKPKKISKNKRVITIVFGSFLDRFWIIFGSFLDRFWIVFVAFLDRSWIVSESSLDSFQIV